MEFSEKLQALRKQKGLTQEQLAKEFCFTEMERISDTHRAIRFCTSWATKEENVDKLCDALRKFADL